MLGFDAHGRERMQTSSSRSNNINESRIRDEIRMEVQKEYGVVINELRLKYDELYSEFRLIRTHFQSCKCGCQINLVRSEHVLHILII